jgi:hypothetical protein
VSTIQDISSPSQWTYVDSAQNPADDASQGLSAEALIKNQRWLRGPEFLWKPKEYWPCPIDTFPSVDDSDPEVKNMQNFAVTQNSSPSIMDRIIERFSSWMKLKKCIAWLLRLCRNPRKKISRDKNTTTKPESTKTIKPLSVDELKHREREIVKFIQRRSFQEEIDSLTSPAAHNTVTKPAIKKSSVIYKLDPIMIDSHYRRKQTPCNHPERQWYF